MKKVDLQNVVCYIIFNAMKKMLKRYIFFLKKKMGHFLLVLFWSFFPSLFFSLRTNLINAQIITLVYAFYACCVPFCITNENDIIDSRGSCVAAAWANQKFRFLAFDSIFFFSFCGDVDGGGDCDASTAQSFNLYIQYIDK